MYKISIKKLNAKKRLVSIEKYATVDDAESAIDKHIERQYSDCSRAWGMVAVEKNQQSANQFSATFKAAIAFIKPLILIYTIEEDQR